MAGSNEPFADVNKLLMNFDHAWMVEEFTKILAQLNVPTVNMDALVAGQKQNLEALTTANNAAVEAVQRVAQLQLEILQKAMREFSEAADDLARAGSPREVAAKQTELAQHAFTTALNNMLELAEIVSEANQKATNALVTRIPQSLDEIQDVMKLRK